MKKQKTLLISAIIASIAIGVTGAYAYYSAQTKTVENTFNVVAGGGESGDTAGVIEETFEPTTAKDLEPRSTFKKEAKINSKLKYSSYAYVFVTIPTINARTSGQTKKTIQDAVTLDFNTTGWQLVKSTKGNATTPSKYLYRYKTVLGAGKSTDNLFTKATVPDFVESDGVSGSINVTGYMLSSVNVKTQDADTDATTKFFG